MVWELCVCVGEGGIYMIWVTTSSFFLPHSLFLFLSIFPDTHLQIPVDDEAALDGSADGGAGDLGSTDVVAAVDGLGILGSKVELSEIFLRKEKIKR